MTSGQIPSPQEIMREFALMTGLSGNADPQRYLWTDAFAVCNYLELFRQTGDEAFRQLALQLVEQVHNTLGQHREDDPRSGWLGGQTSEEARKHPTQGGLRIGKQLPERGPDEPYDQRREWDREGQYYHYLTRWMHALNRVSQDTGDVVYNRWARELARRAHAAFVYEPPDGGQKRMYWKMSIDLSRPLVPSMGHHDPLDGYLTYSALQATAYMLDADEGPDLTAEIADMATICTGRQWATADALGLGGLLTDTYRASRLVNAGPLDEPHLPALLLDDALAGLQALTRQNTLNHPATRRLAFRELGLAIGLHATHRLQTALHQEGTRPSVNGRLQQLAQYLPLREKIVSFWSMPVHRQTDTWLEHRGINMVMLATGLAPTSYLTVLPESSE